ncbi:MAG TPA: ComF family protein [Polyangiaceae bacterium]|jgi:ComF family protein
MSTASSLLSVALEILGGLLAPPCCAACDAPVGRLAAFCATCASTIERPPELDGDATAAFVYGGAVARAIIRLKYERRPDLARPLGDLLWRALEPRRPDLREVVIVPVPLHAARLAERGFNQSALVARRIARQLGASLAPLALARARDTPRQAILDREARLANVAGAFRARQPQLVRDRRVLLVDDVRTTGATLEACARTLLEAGARAVQTAVVASAT